MLHVSICLVLGRGWDSPVSIFNDVLSFCYRDIFGYRDRISLFLYLVERRAKGGLFAC